MTTNCDGHVIEAFAGRHTGWQPVSPKYATRAEALAVLNRIPDTGYELRVYESLTSPKK